MTEQQPAFKKSFGLLDATMIVAGSMIGSGIFIVSADIIRNVGSAGWLIVVWLIAGFMTISAAVSYGGVEWYVSQSRRSICIFKRRL